MRQWIVRGDGSAPRFRNQGKKWWDGDSITEDDLLGIYRSDHIEALVESGALQPLRNTNPRKPRASTRSVSTED